MTRDKMIYHVKYTITWIPSESATSGLFGTTDHILTMEKKIRPICNIGLDKMEHLLSHPWNFDEN